MSVLLKVDFSSGVEIPVPDTLFHKEAPSIDHSPKYFFKPLSSGATLQGEYKEGSSHVIVTLSGPTEAKMFYKQNEERANVEVSFPAPPHEEERFKGIESNLANAFSQLIQRTSYPKCVVSFAFSIVQHGGSLLQCAFNAGVLALNMSGIALSANAVALSYAWDNEGQSFIFRPTLIEEEEKKMPLVTLIVNLHHPIEEILLMRTEQKGLDPTLLFSKALEDSIVAETESFKDFLLKSCFS